MFKVSQSLKPSCKCHIFYDKFFFFKNFGTIHRKQTLNSLEVFLFVVDKYINKTINYLYRAGMITHTGENMKNHLRHKFHSCQ